MYYPATHNIIQWYTHSTATRTIERKYNYRKAKAEVVLSAP